METYIPERWESEEVQTSIHFYSQTVRHPFCSQHTAVHRYASDDDERQSSDAIERAHVLSY